jgi:hypothetical protein
MKYNSPVQLPISTPKWSVKNLVLPVEERQVEATICTGEPKAGRRTKEILQHRLQHVTLEEAKAFIPVRPR